MSHHMLQKLIDNMPDREIATVKLLLVLLLEEKGKPIYKETLHLMVMVTLTLAN